MKELSLFTGAGGGVLGSKLLGWKTIGYVEINDYCQKVIAQRIKDGILDKAPIFGDICGFIKSGAVREYRGFTDVVSAGFPCQPFSVAGRSKGEFDPRNMWPETIAVIREVGPRFALLENVPGLLTHEYFGTILGDLAEMGFNARWGTFSHASLGGQHLRNRIFIVAYTNEGVDEFLGERGIKIPRKWEKKVECENWIEFLVDNDRKSPPSWRCKGKGINTRPIMRRNSDELAFGLDRIAAIGNGQVPIVAASAFKILSGGIE